MRVEEEEVQEYQVSVEANNLLRRVKVFVCPSGRQHTSGNTRVVLTPEGLQLHHHNQTCTTVKWPDFKLQEESVQMTLDENGIGYLDCRMADSRVSLARLPLGQGHEAMFQIRKSDPGALKSVVDKLESAEGPLSLTIACRACSTVCHTLRSLRQGFIF